MCYAILAVKFLEYIAKTPRVQGYKKSSQYIMGYREKFFKISFGMFIAQKI